MRNRRLFLLASIPFAAIFLAVAVVGIFDWTLHASGQMTISQAVWALHATYGEIVPVVMVAGWVGFTCLILGLLYMHFFPPGGG